MEESSHIITEEQKVCEISQEAERRLVVEDIEHNGHVSITFEKVIVVKSSESSAHLGIAEMRGPFERCDSACESLGHAEMPCLPSHLFTEADPTSCNTRNRSFASSGGRSDVEVDVPCQVKAYFQRSADWSCDLYSGHGRSVRLSRSSQGLIAPSISCGEDHDVAGG
jgi:hypothetical protein